MHTEDQPTGKQLCREGPWGPGKQQTDDKSAKHLHGKESKSMIGCVKQMLPAHQGCDPSCLLSMGEPSSAVLCVQILV